MPAAKPLIAPTRRLQRIQEYKNLSGLSASEQVLWFFTRTERLLIRDVRRILCLPVHKELRFNLREWLKRRLRDKISVLTKRALQLVLQKVSGKTVTRGDYVLDPDLDLGWLSEFTFRVHPSDYFTYQETFSDGSVEREYTQQETEDYFPSLSLTSPSDPEVYLPSVSPSFRYILSPELQGKVLEHLGPQAICDVIAACFGRGDKELDSLCVSALESSVRKGVFAFVREALADDLDLFFSAKAREEYWEEQRVGIVSPLWGFPWVTGDLYGRQVAWRSAGFLRAHRDKEACEPPLPEARVPETPSPSSSWGPSTGWD
ncbi:hypothetical protein KFL_006390070 [Klebsormidium nitens]|uniref:Uncharacterized protein n=1 Tax=Klebsormidium nitens TaxID=105231 RepID=A0A1Y1IJX8_KLENI|nr:hypothetical protein KFL_006390070 [Klebsormidium nitens]|eukprot:GAQ90442.1 hypothetical protein KFL_006390070 [Klebsormidium nitens]